MQSDGIPNQAWEGQDGGRTEADGEKGVPGVGNGLTRGEDGLSCVAGQPARTGRGDGPNTREVQTTLSQWHLASGCLDNVIDERARRSRATATLRVLPKSIHTRTHTPTHNLSPCACSRRDLLDLVYSVPRAFHKTDQGYHRITLPPRRGQRELQG